MMLATGPTGNAHAAWQADPQVDPGTETPRGGQNRRGQLVRVELPINSSNAATLRTTIQRLLDQAPAVVRPEERPLVVLEFDTSNGKNGRGSQFEACLALARFLSQPDMNRLELVAYIPGPRGFKTSEELDGSDLASELQGHAVLVAIAAGQIAMHQEARLGRAGSDEQNLEDLVRFSYRDIASRRLALPLPVVMSMLDDRLTLYRVTTDDGIMFADDNELAKLEATGKVVESRTLSVAGEMAFFDSQALEGFRLIRIRAANRNDLARQLRLPTGALESDPALGREWVPVQFVLPEYIDSSTVQWTLRGLAARNPNLIIVRIDSEGGDLDACLRLAENLADYDPNQVRTVAFISGRARGPAALVAQACDHVIMTPDSELGGPSSTTLDRVTIDQVKPKLVALAATKGRDWSIFVGAIDPDLEVTRYREKTTGQIRLLCEQEHAELGEAGSEWLPLGPLGWNEGISAETAEQLYIARTLADDMGAVENFYQLSESPPNLEPTFADRWLENVARTLASPFVAPWLLFGAVFFISTEMSAPGIGVPGFLGTLCLILFFWSQYFEGNAHWLEILLFVTGVVFIVLELFAIPGLGVFGIGGLLMVVISIVLASQTFGLIPRTSQDFARLPASLMPVVAAGVGFMAAMYTMRKVLPNAPYFKRMMLEPRQPKSGDFGPAPDPEALVNWSHLVGRNGQTVTRLAPSGKARIGNSVYDVITDGRMVDRGCKISVVEVSGNRIEVQEIPGDNA